MFCLVLFALLICLFVDGRRFEPVLIMLSCFVAALEDRQHTSTCLREKAETHVFA